MNNSDITKEFFRSKFALMKMTQDLVAETDLDDEAAQERLDAHHKELDNLMDCYGKLLKGFLNIREELKTRESERDAALANLKKKEAAIETQLNALKTSK